MFQANREAYKSYLAKRAAEWGSSNVDDADTWQPIQETITFEGGPPGRPNRIELFTFKNQWGYCLFLSFRNGGMCFGPFLKFCHPYPTRQQAIQGAVDRIIRQIQADPAMKNDPIARKVESWARSLISPKQLELF